MKISRRKAIASLLGGVGCLVGIQISLGEKKPTLPEDCQWPLFPYQWHDLNRSLPGWQEYEVEGVKPLPEDVIGGNPDDGTRR